MEVALRHTSDPPDASELRGLSFLGLEMELELCTDAPAIALRSFAALRAHAERTHARERRRAAAAGDADAPASKRPRTAGGRARASGCARVAARCCRRRSPLAVATTRMRAQ